MRRLALLAFTLVAPAVCAARPQIIHQTQSIDAPPGYYFFGYDVAIDGDWALVAAAQPSPTPANPQQRHDALLYHRVNGQWTLDRVLATRMSTYTVVNQFTTFAMNNGVAAIGSNPVQIFKRTGNTWAEIAHPFTAPPGDPDFVAGYMEWDGNTLLATRYACDYSTQQLWGARISRLNADGTWSPLERLSSGDTFCNQDPVLWGISGDTVVAGTYTNDFEAAQDQVRIFRRSGTTWTPTSAIDGGGGDADVRGNEIFYPSDRLGGTLVYRNDDTQTVVDRIRTVRQSYAGAFGGTNLMHSNEVFLQDDDLFRKNAAGKYEHAARLLPIGIYSLQIPAINGQRLIAHAYRNFDSANQSVLFFDLPSTYTPSPVISTGFANGTSPFLPQLGTFAVVTASAGNRVYRQSDVSGEYRALLGDSDWVEQSIEADIKPTAFSGDDRWAGLAVRYQDPANYYYVTLRSSGMVSLKEMRNGVFTTHVQKALPIVAGKRYHVALQASGNFISVNIDGKTFVYSELGANPIPHGSAAILGYKTAAEYDNVVAAQVGQVPIYDLVLGDCHGPLINSPEWTSAGTDSWNCQQTAGGNVLQQTSIAGDARALVGTPTDDQIVTTRARFTSANTTGSDQWFGITARYVDASTTITSRLRKSNTVSLRKLVQRRHRDAGHGQPDHHAQHLVQPATRRGGQRDPRLHQWPAGVSGHRFVTCERAGWSAHVQGRGGVHELLFLATLRPNSPPRPRSPR